MAILRYIFSKYVYLILFIILSLGGILRFYALATNPPGLYIDEVSIGLNAYDILTTGKDQYGKVFPLAFEALGEYKLPVYIYLTTGAMILFGKSEFAVRFPSAFLGTITIVAVFFLCRELFAYHKQTKKYASLIGLLAAGGLAISPWHLQFSRAGFEASVALFFYTVSILLFLFSVRSKNKFLLVFSVICLVITFYTYDGYKLLAPLSALCGFFILWKNKYTKHFGYIAFFSFAILCLPMLIFSLSHNGLIRFQETSAFSSLPYTSWWKNDIANIITFLKNYLSYFSITYLFRYGDEINRHHVEGFGLLYFWQLPYVLLGLYAAIQTKNTMVKFFIFSLLIIQPILPASTIPSPHALRFLYAVIPFAILTGLGIIQLRFLQKKWIYMVFAGTALLMIVELVYYTHYYYVHYSKEALIDWGGSCKEVAMQIAKVSNAYQRIIIDTQGMCIPEYFSFYIPSVPIEYVATTSALQKTSAKTLLIRPQEKKPVANASYLYSIYLPNLNHDVFAQFFAL